MLWRFFVAGVMELVSGEAIFRTQKACWTWCVADAVVPGVLWVVQAQDTLLSSLQSERGLERLLSCYCTCTNHVSIMVIKGVTKHHSSRRDSGSMHI